MTKGIPAWTDGIDSVSDFNARREAEQERQQAIDKAFEAKREWIAGYNEEAVLWDGFEDAIVGLASRCACPDLVVYDGPKCIEILMQRDGMDWDEANEFFQFNTLGCWAGRIRR
jgi:hypothetical protein